MITGELGKALIKHFEGVKLQAYQDAGGIWTIGYGATFYKDWKKVKKGDRITQEQADALFEALLPKFEAAVNKKVKRTLLQHEFDALVSFAYNAGTGYSDGGKTVDYKLWEHVNNWLGKDGMQKYWETLAVTAGGKKLAGLVRRRKAEANLFTTGCLLLG